jgi:hypothetical protein
MQAISKTLIGAPLAIFLAASLAFSQENANIKSNSIADLRKEIQQLRQELDSLKTLQQNPEFNQQVELDRIEERFDKRIQDLEKKIDAISRSTAPIVFNPRTTAFLNFAVRADNHTVFDSEQEAEINDRPFIRTVELDLRAPVDPYAEAITILAIEDEAGTGFAIDPEEAYGLIKRLPILEKAPLGLKLKVGKYRAPFGVNNRLHLHDVPWTTRPLIVSRYLGTEHGEFFEAGFNPVGMDMDFFLPNPIPGTTLEMNFDVVKAGELGLSGGVEGKQPAFLGHLNLSADWKNEHLLVLGASAYDERKPNSTRLIGADLTYKWAPAERRESRSFVAGGEIMFGKQSFTDTSLTETKISPYGWYTYAQYQMSYWLYLGLRYDWLQEPSDESLITKSWSAYASYYTTEFLRFRLGFEHRQSDFSEQNDINTVLFEINFVFGSHPTEPYWVNR